MFEIYHLSTHTTRHYRRLDEVPANERWAFMKIATEFPEHLAYAAGQTRYAILLDQKFPQVAPSRSASLSVAA